MATEGPKTWVTLCRWVSNCIVNIPHLTYLWNGCSNGASGDPDKLFQVRPHTDCLALDTRRSNFAKLGSTNSVWSKVFLRQTVSWMKCKINVNTASKGSRTCSRFSMSGMIPFAMQSMRRVRSSSMYCKKLTNTLAKRKRIVVTRQSVSANSAFKMKKAR